MHNTHTGTVQSTVVTVHNEVAKVMFLLACVCLRGGCLVPGGLVRGVSAPGRKWSCPVGGCSGGDGCSGRAEWWCLLWGGLVSQHAVRQIPPGETATAADGTDPTGMHSCYQTFC